MWVSVLCCLFVVVVLLLLLCAWWVCSGPLRRTPLRRTPSAGPPTLFFSLSRNSFILFSLSWWSFSLNFGGVFEDRDPQMCTFGLSGCRVKPRRPHQTGPPGLAHEPQTPNVHISGFRPSKHHQNSTRRHPERHNENETVAGKGRKSAKFGPPTLRGPTLRGPTPSGWSPEG